MMKEELEKRVHNIAELLYEQGFEDGKSEAMKSVDNGYKHGAHDAWECARKILDAVVPYDYWDIGGGNHISSVIKHYSVSEAMQKIKEYEQKQKCESCFTKKLTEEKWASAKDCKDCKKMKINCEDCAKEISAECVVDLADREFEGIEVNYPPEELCTYPEYKGKPYFGIKYKENGEEIVGYGTYNPEVLSRYLKDYFMPSEKEIEE